jgi:hypothetical protein
MSQVIAVLCWDIVIVVVPCCPGALAPSMVSWHADAAASLTPQAPGRRRKGALEFLSASANYSWVQLMRRVFAIDVLQCDRCGGHMRILAAIHPPETTRRILDCFGLPNRAPPLTPVFSDATLDLY